MINKPRKPWISVVLTLFSVGLGHIYAGEAKRGFALFFVGQLVFLISMIFLVAPIVPINLVLVILTLFGFLAICVIDAAKAARKFRHSYGLKGYNKWYVYLFFWLATSLLIQPIVAAGIKGNIVQAYTIPAASMKPTLLVGDHIIANKLTYKVSEPKRGDVVVFPFPEDPSKEFVKRIVGIEGEVIEIRDKKVFINGSEFKENYKINKDKRVIPKDIQPRDNFGPFEIPHDSLFVMGDNRDHSYDSRFWGVIKKSAAKGRAQSVYWSWDKETFGIRWDRIGVKIQN